MPDHVCTFFAPHPGEACHQPSPPIVIQFADDDGSADIYREMNPPLTSAEVVASVAKVNKVFDPIGIHFAYDDSQPVQIVRSSRLFRCTDPNAPVNVDNKAAKPPQLDDTLTYLPYALSGKPGLLVVARRGVLWRWDDKRAHWFATADASRGHAELIAVNATWSWAHEIGHLFGLPHAFAASGLTNVQMVQERIDEYKNRHIGRNPLEAIDGDWRVGVMDTPPDPGENFWHNGYWEDRLKLVLKGDQPEEVYITKSNLMSYGGGGYVSPDQAELMRATASFWERTGGMFPTNDVPGGCRVYRATRETIVAPKGVALLEGQQRESYGGSTFFEASLRVGSSLRFIFSPAPGRYRAWFIGTRGLDHAQCELSVGEASPQTIDFWSSGGASVSGKARLPSGRIALGEIEIGGKPITLTLKAVGKSRMSFGTAVGIEGVILQKAE